MLNKQYFSSTEEYHVLYNRANDDLNYVKKLTDIDNDNWNILFIKSQESLENLLKYQKLIPKINPYEIGKSAYYLSWLEHANYCQTGDLSGLMKAYKYYCYIRKMNYFNVTNNRIYKFAEAERIIKYFSRFIWICLLVQERILIRDLLKELIDFISRNRYLLREEKYNFYIDHYEKIQKFRKSIDLFNILKSNNSNLVVNNRLTVNEFYPISYPHQNTLTLSEVIVFSNIDKQIEFEFRTPDMFRMLQLFEYSLELVGVHSHLKNPVKRTLHKPRLYEFKTCMSKSMKRVVSNGAAVLYISTDSYRSNRDGSCDLRELDKNDTGSEVCRINELLLIQYTRRPLLLIVDGKDNSSFLDLTSPFDKPFLCFLSPRQIPEKLNYDTQNGNLFTLFLSSPVSAICLISDVVSIAEKSWITTQKILKDFELCCVKLLQKTPDLKEYLPFISDHLMRRVIIRYCFCSLVLRYHKDFSESVFLPFSSPPIDQFLTANDSLKQKLIELSQILKLKSLFNW